MPIFFLHTKGSAFRTQLIAGISYYDFSTSDRRLDGAFFVESQGCCGDNRAIPAAFFAQED